MSKSTLSVPNISDAQAQQALYQQQKTFELHKEIAKRKSDLVIGIGWAAIALLVLTAGACIYIIACSAKFPDEIVKIAALGLIGDIAGTILLTIFRAVLDKQFQTPLAPVTRLPPDIPDHSTASYPADTGQEQEELVILSAEWGAAGTNADVTGILRSRVSKKGTLGILTNIMLLGDPIRYQEKTLTVVYSHAGQTITKSVPEGSGLYLP